MTWTALTAIIAIAALALGIYNAVVARRAPALARQQQLWDELRTLLEPLVPVLEEARMTLRNGQDVDPEPELVKDAQRRLLALAPRFTEVGVEPGLALLESRISSAWTPWTMSVHHQKMLSSLAARPAEGPFAAENAEERDRTVRSRDAMHRDLEVKLGVALSEITKWVARMDARDKG